MQARSSSSNEDTRRSYGRGSRRARNAAARRGCRRASPRAELRTQRFRPIPSATTARRDTGGARASGSRTRKRRGDHRPPRGGCSRARPAPHCDSASGRCRAREVVEDPADPGRAAVETDVPRRPCVSGSSRHSPGAAMECRSHTAARCAAAAYARSPVIRAAARSPTRCRLRLARSRRRWRGRRSPRGQLSPPEEWGSARPLTQRNSPRAVSRSAGCRSCS